MQLNLNDPKTVAALKANAVNLKKDDDAQPVVLPDTPVREPEIRRVPTAQKEKAEKPVKATVLLSPVQVDQMKREAKALSVDWKTYFQDIVQRAVFEGRIGATYVEGPTIFGRKEVVNAPSQVSTVRRVRSGND